MEWRSESQRKRVLDRCGVPQMFQSCLNPEMAQRVENGESLYLFGPCGTGKTYSACGVLASYKLNKLSRKCIFVPVSEMLMDIRNTFKTNSESTEEMEMDLYSTCDLLVMDDLGAMKITEWAVQSLDIIVDRRYRNQKPTVVTSNYTLKEISENFDNRIASRFGGMCSLIRFGGKDKRVKK